MSAKSTVTQKVQSPESHTGAHCPPGESSDTNLPEVSKQTAGGIAGVVCFVGLTMLLHRRLFDERIRLTSSVMDITFRDPS